MNQTPAHCKINTSAVKREVKTQNSTRQKKMIRGMKMEPRRE